MHCLCGACRINTSGCLMRCEACFKTVCEDCAAVCEGKAIAEGQVTVLALQEEIRRLRVELEVTGTSNRQNAHELEVERRRAAGADLTAEHHGKEKARLQAALRRAGEDQRESMAAQAEQAEEERRRLERRLEAEHNELVGMRQVVNNLEAQFTEVRSLLPAALQAATFALDPESPAAKVAHGPQQLSAAGPPAVRVPVLALRWFPGATLNSTPCWQAIREGVYGMLHQLQTGATLPEQVELTVCEADGRWYCTQDAEVHLFAALLMYQALHRDAPVSALCRVSSPHSLLGLPKTDLTRHTGLSVVSSGAKWRVAPQEEEEFLRAFMSGSQLHEAVEDFLLERRRGRVDNAWQEEVKRDPFNPVPLTLRGATAHGLRGTELINEAAAASFGARAGTARPAPGAGPGAFNAQAATASAAAQAAASAAAAAAARRAPGGRQGSAI
eukprot:TRINITY_DN25953_c0_g1_i1.p1 TRINITY_DN25953_c0_g1~~TRINITY_DN25953_c0_g1_i1.p1  ORF type:complete len:443 (-),score=111.00 TRINITY_DN25953_c0_g1_i1:52-1380(-)